MAQIIVPPRVASIGAFDVVRSIPWRQKRMCGPFIFLDHMGPHTASGSEGDVLSHPHIGLSTLTWLLQGELEHRDSLGTLQTIRPGDVNWMTAGSGIVHSERMPKNVDQQTLEGLQMWVALPAEVETRQPEFQHIPHAELPSWEEDGLHYVLIAGEWHEHRSPLKTFCETLLVQLTAHHQGTMALEFEPGNEIGVYLLEGAIDLHLEEDTPLEPKHLFVSDEAISFSYSDDAKFMLIGGKQFETVPYIEWNFVASNKALIENAKQRWRDQTFEKIEGEEGYVPLPERR